MFLALPFFCIAGSCCIGFLLSAIWKAEKRRRIAHTRYNEVSSRSHTLLTLTVESCSKGAEDDEVRAQRCRGV